MRHELLLAVVAISAAALPAAATAGEASSQIDLSGGGLSVGSPSDVAFPAIHLRGAPVTVEATVGRIDAIDTRPGDPGWTVVAEASPLIDPRGAEMDAQLFLVPAAGAATPGVSLGADLPLDAPRTVARADPGSGTGAWSFTPALRLVVAPGAASAVYTTDLVVTIS